MYKPNAARRKLVEEWAAELEGRSYRFTVFGRREQVLFMWEAGFSQREIAKSTGSTKRTIRDDLAFILGGFSEINGSKPPTLSNRQLAMMRRILWRSPSCVEAISKIDPGYFEEQKRIHEAASAAERAP
jgi:hypothetical protein